jgi:ABC-type amino acid transport substrate-binding protein
MGFLCRAFGWLVLLLLAGTTASAQPAPEKPVRVAVYDVQPYGGKGRDGVFAGASVDLWRRAAEHLNWQYQLTLVQHMDDVLAGVQAGTYDVAIGAITITPERLARVDFSYPTHRSGVAVVFPRQSGTEAAFWDYIDALGDLSPLIAAMVILLLLIGLSMWWFERSHARSAESQSSVTSWHEGVYWAVVTMTTVGYGDKTPKTAVGRTLAVVWMVASLVMVSLLTTSLVARIAVDQVERLATIRASDLVGKRLAAVAESSGAEYLDAQRLAYQKFDTLLAAFEALAAKKTDAVVNSVGALQYLVSTRFSEQVAPPHGLLAPAYMAFALPPTSVLRKPLDKALTVITATPEWRAVEETYFGK